MKIFLSYRTVDKTSVQAIVNQLRALSTLFDFVDHSTIENSDSIWKNKVKDKVNSSELVLFFIGNVTHQSQPVNWEFELTETLGKPFFIIELTDSITDQPDFVANNQSNLITNNPIEIINALKSRLLDSDIKLRLEQYKMMVSSTEKVTEQRLKVNNLFFTVTTTILSISILIGKELHFNTLSSVLLLLVSTIAFLTTFFWEKLIKSYGQLNKGKFKLIAEIENDLGTDMFQREWDILVNEIKYEPNTKTESKIVSRFRWFIALIMLIELIYFIYQINPIICNLIK